MLLIGPQSNNIVLCCNISVLFSANHSCCFFSKCFKKSKTAWCYSGFSIFSF
jgi:hypothetical protein